MVELTAAVVGHPQRVDAVLERELRIFRGLNALDDERHAGNVTDAVEHLPIQCGLELLARRSTPALRYETLYLLTLAVPVNRDIDGDHERAKAARAHALEHPFDPVKIAANVELEPLVTGRGRRAFFERRQRDGTHDRQRTERARAAHLG